MLLLGKCYDAKNMHDMALRQLEEANKELIEMNDTKKEILYMIGLLYEKQGKKGESLAAFQQIYDAEYGYRDVARRRGRFPFCARNGPPCTAIFSCPFRKELKK